MVHERLGRPACSMVNPAETVAYKAADSATNDESQSAVLFRAVDVPSYTSPSAFNTPAARPPRKLFPAPVDTLFKDSAVVFDAPSMTYQ